MTIESSLAGPDGYQHLARLQRAANHFGYALDQSALRASLDQLIASHPQGLWRVRLLLDALRQRVAGARA